MAAHLLIYGLNPQNEDQIKIGLNVKPQFYTHMYNDDNLPLCGFWHVQSTFVVINHGMLTFTRKFLAYYCFLA